MQIKFCSMHSLNLGYALWLAGGAIIYLSNVHHLWGGDDRDEAERLLDAWTDFNTWTKQTKTQSFDCTFWESFV